MFLVRIRVKGSSKFIGKRNSSYALISDRHIEEKGLAVNARATFFVKEPFAKVWTNKSALRGLMTYCGGTKWDTLTFSRYEAVLADGSVMTLRGAVE